MKEHHSDSSQKYFKRIKYFARKKWRYAKQAKKLRLCEECLEPLKKYEAQYCRECYKELIGQNKGSEKK